MPTFDNYSLDNYSIDGSINVDPNAYKNAGGWIDGGNGKVIPNLSFKPLFGYLYVSYRYFGLDYLINVLLIPGRNSSGNADGYGSDGGFYTNSITVSNVKFGDNNVSFDLSILTHPVALSAYYNIYGI